MDSSYLRRGGESSISESSNVGTRRCIQKLCPQIQSLEVLLVQMDAPSWNCWLTKFTQEVVCLGHHLVVICERADSN